MRLSPAGIARISVFGSNMNRARRIYAARLDDTIPVATGDEIARKYNSRNTLASIRRSIGLDRPARPR